MVKFNITKTASTITWSILIILLIPLFNLINSSSIFLIEWVILSLRATPISFILIFDLIRLSFSCVVLFISANVLIFSTIYISHDVYKDRFTILVLLFILSINLLIYIPHLIILLLGWDGLGLVSFILVIYYQNPSSIAARIITALTNRIGDVAILLAIGFTLVQGHWLITNISFSLWIPLQVILITLAAITKSAQMPFSSWLPAAIAAPTPVSALVHSSTLVTAGVFLLIRFYPMLHTYRYFNRFILFIATSTTFISGLSANTECDFKKIVALSTLSQLGIIIFSLGLNMPILAYFHMITHALFKALLFICVGSFINYHIHTQDLRWIGNLTYQIPSVISCIILANLALSGFPFLAGFYSKDIIIESIIRNPFNLCLFFITLISLGLTSFYSIRATIVAIIRPQINTSFSQLSEPFIIIKAIILLSISAICIGSLISWIVKPLANQFSSMSRFLKLLPLFLILIGAIISWSNVNILTNVAILLNFKILNYARCMIWFLVPLSTQFTIKLPIFITHRMIKSLDHGWLEIISSQGSNVFINTNTKNLIAYIPRTTNIYLLIRIISLFVFYRIFII